MAKPSLEELGSIFKGKHIFQLYIEGDEEWVRKTVRRAGSSGCFGAICATVDTAHYSRRDRDLQGRFSPAEAIDRPNLAAGPVGKGGYRATFTWDRLERLCSWSELPVIVKGILTAEDARSAVKAGASAVYVSNHGGRQLDHAPSSIEMLPEIAEAVGTTTKIIVDSGFLRGTDILKAVALGASAVGLGKLHGAALAAGGWKGMVRALEILEAELTIAMALTGCPTLSQVSRDVLRPHRPVDAWWGQSR